VKFFLIVFDNYIKGHKKKGANMQNEQVDIAFNDINIIWEPQKYMKNNHKFLFKNLKSLNKINSRICIDYFIHQKKTSQKKSIEDSLLQLFEVAIRENHPSQIIQKLFDFILVVIRNKKTFVQKLQELFPKDSQENARITNFIKMFQVYVKAAA
jgi:hypothetical protein